MQSSSEDDNNENNNEQDFSPSIVGSVKETELNDLVVEVDSAPAANLSAANDSPAELSAANVSATKNDDDGSGDCQRRTKANHSESDAVVVSIGSIVSDDNRLYSSDGEADFVPGNKNKTESYYYNCTCKANSGKSRSKSTSQLPAVDCVCKFRPKKGSVISKQVAKTHRHSQPWCAVEIPPVTFDGVNRKKRNLSGVATPTSHDGDSLPSKDGADLEKSEQPKVAWYNKYSRHQRFTLLSLCLVDFTSFLGMSIMAPFFPMEAKQKGMDEATVGFVFSNYALVMFLMSPVFGRILPTVGPKFLFLSGLFLSGGCTILFGVLDEMNGRTFTVFCFVIRSFEALGAAAYNTASCTIIAEMFPDNVGAVFGILETFVGLGMTIGPAIGAGLYSLQGYKLPFFLLGTFMILMVPVNVFLLPENPTQKVKMKSGTLLGMLRLPTVLIMCLVVLVQASAWSFLDPFLQPHLEQEFQLSTANVGLIFLMISATYGIFCPIWGWVADKWERTSSMMVFGMILSGAALVLLGPSDLFPFIDSALWINMVALIILGVSQALAIIPTFQSMMDYAIDSGYDDDVSTYSVISGLWSAAYSLGEFVGPSLGGVLVKEFQFPSAATGMAGCTIGGAVILVVYETVMKFFYEEKPEVKEKSEEEETAPLLGEKCIE